MVETAEKKEQKKQILLTCRTHEMIKAEFPEYSEPNSEVPQKDFHTTLGIMNSNLPSNGFQLYVGENVDYKNYLSMLKYMHENPLKEEVFLKMQEKVKAVKLNEEKNDTL